MVDRALPNGASVVWSSPWCDVTVSDFVTTWPTRRRRSSKTAVSFAVR